MTKLTDWLSDQLKPSSPSNPRPWGCFIFIGFWVALLLAISAGSAIARLL